MRWPRPRRRRKELPIPSEVIVGVESDLGLEPPGHGGDALAKHRRAHGARKSHHIDPVAAVALHHSAWATMVSISGHVGHHQKAQDFHAQLFGQGDMLLEILASVTWVR